MTQKFTLLHSNSSLFSKGESLAKKGQKFLLKNYISFHLGYWAKFGPKENYIWEPYISSRYGRGVERSAAKSVVWAPESLGIAPEIIKDQSNSVSLIFLCSIQIQAVFMRNLWPKVGRNSSLKIKFISFFELWKTWVKVKSRERVSWIAGQSSISTESILENLLSYKVIYFYRF